MKDPYATLGVSKSATAEEIKKAYRKLAKKHHPDVNPGDKKSEERFKDVSGAFDVIGDPKKRSLFDEFGDAALHSGFDEAKARQYRAYQEQPGDRPAAGFSGGRGFASGQGFGGFSPEQFDQGDLGSMMGDLFGRRAAGRAQRARTDPAAGDDAEAAIEVDLRDAVLGAEREISLNRPSTCPDCQGSGARKGVKPQQCPQCGGSGLIKMGGGAFRGPCPRCNGLGTLQEACPRCGGEGSIQETARLKIKIPAGVETGSRVRLVGQGSPGERGGDSGDLYLRITVREHPLVRISGRDLSLDLPITTREALEGGEVTAPTFEGPVKLKIPPGSQSGRRLRLRGRGLPALRGSSSGEVSARGDLYAVLQIVLPPDSPEARAAAEVLEKLYTGDVRSELAL